MSKSYFPYLCILVAILLMTPCLDEGFFMDDWIHRLKLTGKTPSSHPESIFPGMFEFSEGKPNQIQASIDSGMFPWWTSKTLKLAFLRPLTELSHLLDYHFWPNNPFLMHLHNLFWYGLILFLIFIFYKRILVHTWMAGLAILLFSLDSAHSITVVWIANRNALLATCFGIAALLLHDRWRRDGFKPGCILASLLFICSLLSGEFGLGTCAYLFAYALCIDSGETRSKAISLLPYGMITILWYSAYTFLGYGAAGSGAYIDPGSEPIQFLGAFVERFPILLHGQIGLFGTDLYALLPHKPAIVFWCMTVFILIMLWIVLFPLLKSDRVARFWGLGMILSLFPVIASEPGNRLLLFAGLGGMALLAQFFSAWFEKSEVYGYNKVYRQFTGILVCLLLIVHLIIAPIYKVTDAEFYQAFRPVIDQPESNSVLTPDHQDQIIITLNPPLNSMFFYYTICRIHNEADLITPYIALANGGSPLKVFRRSERELEIFDENGYSSGLWDNLFRNPQKVMPIGHQVMIDKMRVTVLSLTEDNYPAHVHFEFDRPLEDVKYKFIYWNMDHYEKYSLPAIGQTDSIKMFNFLEFVTSI